MIARALDLQADDIALSNFNEKYNCSIKAEKFGRFMKFGKEKKEFNKTGKDYAFNAGFYQLGDARISASING